MAKIHLLAALGFLALAGCVGGAERAATLPTPILCKTILDLSPIYVKYDEYINELKKRGEDCGRYMGDTQNIRVR